MKTVRSDLRKPDNFEFWKQVHSGDFLEYLKKIFEEVVENISK